MEPIEFHREWIFPSRYPLRGVSSEMKPKEQIIEQPRRLTRSIEDRKIAGVCAGIADYMGWDVGLVRIAYVLLSIGSVGFPGLLVYIILWILVPEEQPAS